jgi:hypothetical protein
MPQCIPSITIKEKKNLARETEIFTQGFTADEDHLYQAVDAERQ